jgi:hypothetical protein
MGVLNLAMKLCLLATILIAAGCRSATSPALPDPPPKPAGAIACVGHRNSYCVPMSSIDNPTWYAYWSVSADFSHAVLRVGIMVSDQDSIFLVHTNPKRANTDSTDWWQYMPNTNDSIVGWQYLHVTSDSLITGSHGVDCGKFYYLKKQ